MLYASLKSAEEIIHKLCEAEVPAATGRAVDDTARRLGVTMQTYYRWRKEPIFASNIQAYESASPDLRLCSTSTRAIRVGLPPSVGVPTTPR